MSHPNNIIFTDDIATEIQAFFNSHSYSNIAVIVDENTLEYCYPKIDSAIPSHIVIDIKSGEEEKNLETCQQIWNELTKHAFDRKSLVINLGGGVIGDMGGFCAATYKRGIDFINIPTTLLAQVDASIGGKLGIDFQNYKNHIGVFQNPLKVMLDANFFDTLSDEELRSGYAEIIKHCLIRDANMFYEITKKPYEKLDLFTLTKHSVKIKDWVVEEDPTEKGLRKILNFGHTVGHAIESFYLESEEKKLLHGEAIAIGMICEAYLSVSKCDLTQQELDKIVSYIKRIYNPKKIKEGDIDEIVQLTKQDKKNEGHRINCSLLRNIGACTFDIQIDEDDIKASIVYFNELI
jgi:3-dehydroquinate synthase